MTAAPPNSFPQGTKLTVGSHQISIIKYVSQGGFAYVYTCGINPPFRNSKTACLKRVVVPSKTQLSLLRQEVDAMKRLRGNAHIVSYIDSHASRLPTLSPDQTQQYEVLLLMEYCSGLSLIDFMNTRLTQRLSEPEVLSIMGQITTAVAMCHHLEPPLIHRDIKIENVLIDGNGTYKLCDFGSAVNYCKAPSNRQELNLLHDDIMQHTTPQYRAPEMIDLSRGFPINDKSDVWALGIFLYKLCYFATPFELPDQRSLQDLEQNILACLTSLRFPVSPKYSSRLQNIINCCLREDPRRRPNALQLLQEVCQMQNITVMPDVIPYSVKVQHLANKSLANPQEQKLKPNNLKEETLSQRKALKQNNKMDVFSKINKAELLKMNSNPTHRARPKSEIFAPTKSASNFSSASLHDMVQQQVKASTEEMSDIRYYEDRGQDTIEFLRLKEEEGLSSNQDTGGSFKSSIRNGLPSFSTGGSIKSQRSGSLGADANHTTRDKNYDDSEKPFDLDGVKRRSSIQRRVQQLLFNKDKKPVKNATGYGKHTDQDDISAINHYEQTTKAALVSPTINKKPPRFDFDRISVKLEKIAAKTATSKASTKKVIVPKTRLSPKDNDTNAPPCPPGLKYRIPMEQLKRQAVAEKAPSKYTQAKKQPPPKPTKPQHLKSGETRSISDSSEIFLPDLDDLEKLFSRRYPSYV